ncbi:hypothetical protein ACLB2K_005330 [Fragaria x ananassa]
MVIIKESSPTYKYHVFLSFRGEDTRNNFTGHLYSALSEKGIVTFMDDQLIRGEEISPALIQAIEQSKISIVVFSENYASSKWCLDELVKILDCKKKIQQIVLPVFFKVDPSDVRNHRGSFGEGLANLERKFKDKDQVQEWKTTLFQAASLLGWYLDEHRSESSIIREIVERISKEDVEIQHRVQAIQKLLSVQGRDVHMMESAIQDMATLRIRDIMPRRGDIKIKRQHFTTISLQVMTFACIPETCICTLNDTCCCHRSYKLEVRLEDEDGSATAMLMGKSADALFGITCGELVNSGNSDKTIIPEVMKDSKNKYKIWYIGYGTKNDFMVRGVYTDSKETDSEKKEPLTSEKSSSKRKLEAPNESTLNRSATGILKKNKKGTRHQSHSKIQPRGKHNSLLFPKQGDVGGRGKNKSKQE